MKQYIRVLLMHYLKCKKKQGTLAFSNDGMIKLRYMYYAYVCIFGRINIYMDGQICTQTSINTHMQLQKSSGSTFTEKERAHDILGSRKDTNHKS